MILNRGREKRWAVPADIVIMKIIMNRRIPMGMAAAAVIMSGRKRKAFFLAG